MPVTRVVQSRVSAVFLTAPEDGVAPSILLTVQDSKKKPLSQYLYNVPDGASRLMLEHKARPDPQLRAVFLSGCSPAEAGGLGSVVLRLKQDGHASVQLVGPQGEQQNTLRRVSHTGCAGRQLQSCARNSMTPARFEQQQQQHQPGMSGTEQQHS